MVPQPWRSAAYIRKDSFFTLAYTSCSEANLSQDQRTTVGTCHKANHTGG